MSKELNLGGCGISVRELEGLYWKCEGKVIYCDKYKRGLLNWTCGGEPLHAVICGEDGASSTWLCKDCAVKRGWIW